MKKVIGFILGFIFLIAVIVGIVIGSYTLIQPSREGDSRAIINGPWYTPLDKDGKGIVFNIDDSGKTVIHYYYKEGKYDDYKDKDIIMEGYARIDDDDKKIKLLVKPDYTDNTDLGFEYKLKFFATIKYTDLDYVYKKKHSDSTQVDYHDATCTFVIGDKVYKVTQKPNDKDVYNSKTVEW